MLRQHPIKDIYAREILDSRGNPTVETEVLLGETIVGRASVPSGASTGEYEAVEMRDEEEERYGGKGVMQAVHYVNSILAEAMVDQNALQQLCIDDKLCREDGSKEKRRLGANSLLSISMAAAKAAAEAVGLPLYRYLGGAFARQLPVPMMNILNGGAHADNTVDFQEFMIMPVGACCFSEGLRICAEIYHQLKKNLAKAGLSTGVGDEGGFAPNLPDAFAVLDTIMTAVNDAGYRPQKDIVIALDAAASELYQEQTGMYYFPGESRQKQQEILRDSREMIAYYRNLVSKYPICSIEDGLDENDWEGWTALTRELGEQIQLVGDDLFVTNPERLQKGIQVKAGNAILVKVNQIGTLSEAVEAIRIAKANGYRTVLSHRSGETEDTLIADLAVACGAGQIKTGAPCRSERTAKYNQLLRIEEELGFHGLYENPFR